MVVGPDSYSVQRAREQLELQEECIPLESHQIEWLSNKFNYGTLSKLIVYILFTVICSKAGLMRICGVGMTTFV